MRVVSGSRRVGRTRRRSFLAATIIGLALVLAAVASADQSLPTTSSVAVPAVSVPVVKVPAVKVPALSAPTVKAPSVSTPQVSVPKVAVPTVSTPSVSTPVATTPKITTPAVTTPAVTTPKVTTPTVTTPKVTTPTVTTPKVTTPVGTVPSTTSPAATVPSATTRSVSVPSVSTPATPAPSSLTSGRGSSTSSSSTGGATRGGASIPSVVGSVLSRSGQPDTSTASAAGTATAAASRLAAGAPSGSTSGSSLVSGASGSAAGATPSGMSARVSRADRARAVSGKGSLKPPKKNASAKAWNRYLHRLVRALGGCVSSLTPQAQQILMWRTGHGPGRGESETQVARRLGTSVSRERRLESRAAQALRLASATGRCGQSPVPVSVSSGLLAGAPPQVLQDLTRQTQGSQATQTGTSSPTSGHLSQPKAAGSGGSKSSTRPTVTIQKSALPSLPTAGSGFPWLLILLAALATGALMLAASRRSLVLTYVETSRQRRRAASAHRGTEVGAGSADTGDAAPSGTAADAAGVAGAAPAAPEAAGPLESLAGWVAAGEVTHRASPIDRGQELESQGDLAAAMAAYSRADADGDARGARRVGRLLESRGDMAGAIAAYSRADERGDSKGSVSLGILLAERGSLTGALGAFERADRRGDASGAFNRALLLEERGDIRAAVAALRRAYERGDAEMTQRAREALAHLGVPVD